MNTDLFRRLLSKESLFMIPVVLVLTLAGTSCKSTDKSQILAEPENDETAIKPEDMTHNQPYSGSTYYQVIEYLKINQYQQDPKQAFPQFVSVKEHLAHQQFLRDIGRTLDSQHDILDIEKLDRIKPSDKVIENFDYVNGVQETKSLSGKILKSRVGNDPSYTTIDGSIHQHTGYRKVFHQNGICLTGEWRIYQDQIEGYKYSGLYEPGTQAKIIMRGSPSGTAVVPPTKGLGREAFSFGYAGKIFPTMDPNQRVKTANFFVQTDLGGQEINNVTEARVLREDFVMKNAPGVTAINKTVDELPITLSTGIEFKKFDTNTTERQLYQIAERYTLETYGSTQNKSNSPRLMKLVFKGTPLQGTPQDFRKEILQYLELNGQLIYKILVAHRGEVSGPTFKQKSRPIGDWLEIGEIILSNEAYVSDGCDRYIHFQHPPWRNNNDDGSTRSYGPTVRPYHKFKHHLGEGAVNPHYQQQLPEDLKK